MITVIIGARPQFIKHQPLQLALENSIECRIVHTGQHYDLNMSDIFFKELSLKQPDIHLGIGSDSHSRQTAKMLMAIEKDLNTYKSELLIVYGDTNSTLAGAVAAAKLDIPIAHIEAGLRSYNRQMPEEINRIITDRISRLLFVPSDSAAKILFDEGIVQGVYNVGDIMYDAVLFFLPAAEKRFNKLEELGISVKNYYYTTIHRPSNTDDYNNLNHILAAFSKLDKKVVFPIHPRTKKMMEKYDFKLSDNIIPLAPVGYLDSLMFMKNASAILTDSGGMQKEAFYLKTPCITIRPETEWKETVDQGWNRLVESEESQIISSINNLSIPRTHDPVYGDGKTAGLIKEILSDYLK